jgi:hypothetical protein
MRRGHDDGGEHPCRSGSTLTAILWLSVDENSYHKLDWALSKPDSDRIKLIDG